jgi:hypothetical protein
MLCLSFCQAHATVDDAFRGVQITQRTPAMDVDILHPSFLALFDASADNHVMPSMAFISYRRSDSQQAALGLDYSLRSSLGPKCVFMDRSGLSAGDVWRRILTALDEADAAASQCNTVDGSRTIDRDPSFSGREPVEGFIPGDYQKSRQELKKVFLFSSFASLIRFMSSAGGPLLRISRHGV